MQKDDNMEEKRKQGRPRKYATNDETKIAQRQIMRVWFSTKEGRAYRMARNYTEADKKFKRGESTITPEYIIENIFTSKCYWCGETDWTKLGCDRIDNNLPHTPNNVICSCVDCNTKRNRHSVDYFTKYQGSLAKAGEQLSLF